ncbi:MAG: ABC transporter substrate-binding protein [Lachnospiraceae bacterium]|nr:ABC transporter substrate-binding protein [Lachnospiraceae bacterium]
MKKSVFFALIISFAILLSGCGSYSSGQNTDMDVQDEDKDLIVIGFSQVGAESDWRKANTESMLSTFTREKGYDLIYEDAQQKQQNQITAIRTFIQREVDYIVLAPVTEDGWDTVLGEAHDAGIPVIIVDRQVAVNDNDLFTCWVGSDFELEGRKACEWLRSYCDAHGIEQNDINIVDIQGTEGSSAQLGRTKGLNDAVRSNGWNLLDVRPGEYTQAKGREATAYLLQLHPDINVVYCENDNEAFGAIEAIEAAGKSVGTNIEAGQIMVLSFDGVSDLAVDYCKNGSISCIGECNPLHGPRVERIIENLEAGIVPEKFEYVDEAILSGDDTITNISLDGVTYSVELLER